MDTHEWWQPSLGQGRVEAASQPLAAGASRLSYWALLAFTAVLLLAPQEHFSALKPLHLAFVFALIAAAAYLYSRFQHGSNIKTHPEFIWAAALLLWAIVTVPFSLWPGGSINTIIHIFIKALIIFWLLGFVVDTPARLKTIVWLLTLCSLFLSLSAVHTFFAGGFHAQVQSQGGNRISGYTSGLTSNPNDLAMMLNLILPLTIGLIFCTRRMSLRIVLSVLAVLDIIGVIATFSRGGFLALAIILIAYAVCLCRRGAWLTVILLAALLMISVPLLPGGYTNRLATITSSSSPTGSKQARLQGMTDAAHYSLRHPILGTGIGNSILQLNRMREANKWHLVHDVYLRYSMELGWPGLILFLLLLYGALRACRAPTNSLRSEKAKKICTFWQRRLESR